ncbi:MAG TPA: hypothetical protein VFX59_23065, partial [Polyangiales bacterium]|nr:hypothetical protein [Polyangiales bacterium]
MRLLVAAVLACFTLPLAARAQMAPAESALGVPPENAPSTQPESPPAQPAPAEHASEDTHAQNAYYAQQLQHADAWVAFEGQRDQRTRSAERVFFPLTLGVEGALAVAYAVGASDVTDTSKILAGVTAGVTLAAMVPTLLAKSRGGRRAWFAAG